MRALAGVIVCAAAAWFVWRVLVWWVLAREARRLRDTLDRVTAVCDTELRDRFGSPETRTFASTIRDITEHH